MLLALAAACGGSRELTVEVAPQRSLADEPVHIRVEGAEPREIVSVEVRVTDAAGARWRSAASFRADDEGSIDLDRAAPASGDYDGVWGMGLVSSLRPVRSLAVFEWDDQRPLSFEVRARSTGEEAATAVARRLSPHRLTTIRLTLARDGFLGEYVQPVVAGRRTAVLVLGGSDGGLSPYSLDLARSLAARGYPSLAVAYHGGEPGLPDYLYRIPLEYFAKALRWLERRPEVDSDRMLAFGVSRGSEAALLLGVHFPQLVYGVVASVPSNVAHGPSWTLAGAEIPYTNQHNEPRPTDDPGSVIPAERIRGPVFAFCGTADTVWTSCAYARELVARRRRHDRPATLVALRGASHYIGGAVPYSITSLPPYAADARALEKLWPRLLAFLARAAG